MALIADSCRLRAATGWAPAETLDTGLAKTIAWWRDLIGSGRYRRGSEYLV
jgi:NDP-hexose 4,6-dehydratase